MSDCQDEFFAPVEARAKVGQRITTLVAFSSVPAGTTGVVLEPDDWLSNDWLTTLAIRWDLPGSARPSTDWFSRREYEKYLVEITDE